MNHGISNRPLHGLAALLLCLGTAQAQSTLDGARPGNVIGTGQSLPRSDSAGNLNQATTHSMLAPNLPAPPAGDGIQTLLLDAGTSIRAGRTGQAQEALERAETRALDRSVPRGSERLPAASRLVSQIGQALQALAAGQNQQSLGLIEAALPKAAQSDIPR